MTSNVTLHPYNTVTIGTEIDEPLRRHLQALLRVYNVEVTGLGVPETQPLILRVTDAHDHLVGGLVSHTT